MGRAIFEVGDRVRVFHDGTEIIRDTGTIVDVDSDWVYPYEIEFDEGRKYSVELFAGEELEPIFNEDVNYINIKFQNGAIQENGVNGAQIEDVIDVLVDKLLSFQKSEFACRENALAITKLEEARLWLNERTRKRKEQGVEGKSEKHE